MSFHSRFVLSALKISRDLPRYSRLIGKAITKPLLVYLALVGNIVLLSSAFLFYLAEVGQNPNVTNFGDALWWSFSTVSTVGYGDIYPYTALGRVVGVILIIVGVFFFLTFMAVLGTIVLTIASREIFESEQATMKEYHNLMNEMKKISSDLEKIKTQLEQKNKNEDEVKSSH